jgi:glycosyltransferase involved in cell wall biosynthesis
MVKTTERPARILYTLPDLMLSSYVRQVVDFCTYLDREWFTPIIAAADVDDDGKELVYATGVPVLQMQQYPRPGEMRLESVLKAPFDIRKHRIDIQHSLHWSSFWLEPIIAKTGGVKCWIYTKQCMKWEEHGVNWYLRSALADSIVNISHTQDELLARFKSKTRYIPNGVDTNRFKPAEVENDFRVRNGIPPDAFVIGYLAHFIEVKDHPTLLLATKRLLKEGLPVHLALAGQMRGDEYEAKIRRMCHELGIEGHVTFLGSIRETPDFLNSLDCFAFPSTNEAFGIALVEAMSCGLPVVAVRSPGPMDIVVDGETGVLVAPKDPVAMADAISKYVRDPMWQKLHGKNARARAEKVFSSRSMVKQYEILYKELLYGHKSVMSG